MGKKSLLTKEQLEDLLTEKSAAQIAKDLSVDPALISYYIKKYLIVLNKQTSDDLLIQWIYDNCFSLNGSLNNKIADDSWWINRNYQNKKNEISFRTKWLETDNITQRLYHIINNIDEIPICKSCNNLVKFKQFKSGYNEYCSKFCATQGEERNANMVANHDYDDVFKKVRAKTLEKYGDEHYYRTEDFKEKSRKIKEERYGNPYYNNMEKNRETNLERYGVESLLLLPEQQQKMQDKKIELYGYNGIVNFKGNTSKAELELLEFLNSLGYKFEKNHDILGNREIDAYCDELKLGIEYCGLYWHSSAYKNDDYHIDKMRRCNAKGIQLITIFEDEWLLRKQQVKNFIKAKLGIFDSRIYARKCNVIEVEKPFDFFESFHIQGRPNVIEKAFALCYNNEMLGCVSYSKHHRNNGINTKLSRLAFKNGIQCVGGASKLIKTSLSLLNTDIVVTWSDNRWTDGTLYEKCGFVLDEHLRHDHFFVKNNIRYKKQSMKKSKTGCPDNITEIDFAKMNGYETIHDCGKKRWIYNKGE